MHWEVQSGEEACEGKEEENVGKQRKQETHLQAWVVPFCDLNGFMAVFPRVPNFLMNKAERGGGRD